MSVGLQPPQLSMAPERWDPSPCWGSPGPPLCGQRSPSARAGGRCGGLILGGLVNLSCGAAPNREGLPALFLRGDLGLLWWERDARSPLVPFYRCTRLLC